MRSCLRIAACLVALVCVLTGTAGAQSPVLAPNLAGLSFLVGSWSSGIGRVADTGESSRGSSVFTVEVDGGALLRRDHTELSRPNGSSSGSFDQVMLIYGEGGMVHADYTDGTHVIHYRSATIAPGRSVVFTTGIEAGAPAFRLTYDLATDGALNVLFEVAPPGQSTFKTVASGVLHRA